MLRIGGAGHAPGARTNGRAEGGLYMPEQRIAGFGAHTEPRVCEGATAVRPLVSSCHHYHQQKQQVSVTYAVHSGLQLSTRLHGVTSRAKVETVPSTAASFNLLFVFLIVLITTNCSRTGRTTGTASCVTVR
jgi:hypothetical protein